MGEAVVFVLFKDNHVLLEFRPIDGREEMLIPGGGIELFDNSGDVHYSINAMHREIGEELAGSVKILKYHYVGKVTHEVTGSLYHVYMVPEWEGVIPSHTIENNLPEGRLAWVALDEAIANAAGNAVRVYALEKAKEYLSNNTTNKQITQSS